MLMQLDLSGHRRRSRWWLVPVLAALLLILPRLAVLPPAAARWAEGFFGAHYAAQLETLRQENFALHRLLAQSADAQAENEALRQLVGCGRSVTGVTPARVMARTAGGFILACPDAAPGDAVLDAAGRYAGTVTTADGDCCAAAFSATAGLCGAYAGLVTPGKWQLTDLPADCTLAAGDIVTTAGGDWLGTLAEAPVPDAAGLTARAALTDTAELYDAVYFVRNH